MKIDFLPINESIVLTSSNHYASSAAYFNKVGLYFCLCLIYKNIFVLNAEGLTVYFGMQVKFKR